MYSSGRIHQYVPNETADDLAQSELLAQQPWTPLDECLPGARLYSQRAYRNSLDNQNKIDTYASPQFSNGQLMSPPPHSERELSWYFPQQHQAYRQQQRQESSFGPPDSIQQDVRMAAQPWLSETNLNLMPTPYELYPQQQFRASVEHPSTTQALFDAAARAVNAWPLHYQQQTQLITPPYEAEQVPPLTCQNDVRSTQRVHRQPHQCHQNHGRTGSHPLLYSPRLKRQHSGDSVPFIDAQIASPPRPPPLTRKMAYPHTQKSTSSSSSVTDITGRSAESHVSSNSSLETSPRLPRKHDALPSQQELKSPLSEQACLVEQLDIAAVSASQCMPRLQRIIKEPPRPLRTPPPGARPVNKVGMTIGLWTKQDDSELRALITAHLAKHEDEPIPWSVIGRSLQAPRSGQQCQAHWTEALDPKVMRGRWTPALDKQLLQLTVFFQKKWARISEQIPGKTQRQCRSRWFALQSKAEKLGQTPHVE